MNVYKLYNQDQLNAQYNTRLQVPEYATYFDRWEKLSRQTANELSPLTDIHYGDHFLERLDIYPSAVHHSKTLVFIHGGYWHLLDKSLFHFLAEFFVTYNVTTVLINYPLAPKSSISEIVGYCRKALTWLHNNITQYNGKPDELYLMGHSAGGHLASMMLVEKEAIFVRAIISLSGLFKLEPVMLSYLNESIGMDRENAIKNSPVFLAPTSNCPILLVTGTDESDEFKSQSEELNQAWKEKTANIELLKVPDKNHYSILDSVVEEGSPVRDAIFRLMNITPVIINTK